MSLTIVARLLLGPAHATASDAFQIQSLTCSFAHSLLPERLSVNPKLFILALQQLAHDACSERTVRGASRR